MHTGTYRDVSTVQNDNMFQNNNTVQNDSTLNIAKYCTPEGCPNGKVAIARFTLSPIRILHCPLGFKLMEKHHKSTIASNKKFPLSKVCSFKSSNKRNVSAVN